MIHFKQITLSLCLLSLCACTSPNYQSITLIHRDGSVEKIKKTKSLKKFNSINFLENNPYKQVSYIKKQIGSKQEGSLISYYENNQVKQWVQVRNNQVQGTYREWFPKGQIKLQASVTHGTPQLSPEAVTSWVFQGDCFSFYPNGNKQAYFYYDKGLLEGKSKLYYPQGNLKEVSEYNKGLLHGTKLTFYKNNTLQKRENYRYNKLCGKSQLYTHTPYLCQSEELWVEDRLIEGKYYDKKHNIVSQVSNRQGTQSIFSNQGKLIKTIQVSKGVPEGFLTIFSPEGHITQQFIIQDGKKEGRELTFYPSSTQIKSSFYWQKGQINGPVTSFYPNGEKESEKTLYHTNTHGKSLAWYPSGQLMYEEIYESGKLIQGYYFKLGKSQSISQVINGKGIATLFNKEGVVSKIIHYREGFPEY